MLIEIVFQNVSRTGKISLQNPQFVCLMALIKKCVFLPNINQLQMTVFMKDPVELKTLEAVSYCTKTIDCEYHAHILHVGNNNFRDHNS